MLVHTVYFWLKEGLSDEQLADFRTRLAKLGAIDAVEAFYWGTPAATADRSVIDKSFDYSITVVVRDVAAHDRYQEDPVHRDFVEHCAPRFERIVVYDVD